jgi:hypothetical protein
VIIRHADLLTDDSESFRRELLDATGITSTPGIDFDVAAYTIAQQIDRLDRDRHPAVCGSDEAVIVRGIGNTVAATLETIAQRLAQMED